MTASALAALAGRSELSPTQREITRQIARLLELVPGHAIVTEARYRPKARLASIIISHQTDARLGLFITLGGDSAVVSHTFDHEHFGPPDDDRPASDAVHFIRKLLTGSVKVEVRHGILWRRARSYERIDDGWREIGTCYAPYPLGRWLARQRDGSHLFSFMK